MRITEIIAGSRAPLYHGTDVINCANIITENILYEGGHWGRPNEPHGIRFTRDPRRAWSFGESEVDMPCVLVFDQTRLTQRYRMVPYQDVDAAGNNWPDEMEEVLLAQQIPVSPYLTAIFANPKQIRAARIKEWAEYAIEERGFTSARSYYQTLDRLAKHPLLKAT